MNYVTEVINVVRDVLMLGDRADQFDASTQLMGSIPEFDSMAVVSIVTALEDEFGCVFDDDEINADVFESIGSLANLVADKLN